MSYRIICWSLILFACFYGLGRRYHCSIASEGMYAAIARDMLKSGDFYHPAPQRRTLLIEKPPLLYCTAHGSLNGIVR